MGQTEVGVFQTATCIASHRMLECVGVHVTFDPLYGTQAIVSMVGGRGRAMYPFSIWMDDGMTWDGKFANSTENMYHCWGWGQQECPNSQTVNLMFLLRR